MTLNIRSDEAEALARELARLDGTTVAEAVISALRETIDKRTREESATEAAKRILARRGLGFPAKRTPVPADAYHDLDADEAGNVR